LGKNAQKGVFAQKAGIKLPLTRRKKGEALLLSEESPGGRSPSETQVHGKEEILSLRW